MYMCVVYAHSRYACICVGILVCSGLCRGLTLMLGILEHPHPVYWSKFPDLTQTAPTQFSKPACSWTPCLCFPWRVLGWQAGCYARPSFSQMLGYTLQSSSSWQTLYPLSHLPSLGSFLLHREMNAGQRGGVQVKKGGQNFQVCYKA